MTSSNWVTSPRTTFTLSPSGANAAVAPATSMSTQVTSWPAATRIGTMRRPMKPAPPITKMDMSPVPPLRGATAPGGYQHTLLQQEKGHAVLRKRLRPNPLRSGWLLLPVVAHPRRGIELDDLLLHRKLAVRRGRAVQG